MRVIHTVAMLAAAISLMLSGCSSAPTSDEVPTPVYRPVSASTWRDVDEEIWSASKLAAGESEAYARGAMGEWMEKVRQRTEAVFVPWYLDYWTQQWVSVKVAWYELSQEEGDPSSATRLAAYLQGKYEYKVLQPVEQEADPHGIRDAASVMYLQLVSEKLRGLPNRYGIPPEEFRSRLAAIPAIDIPGDPERSASLSILVHSGRSGRVTTSPAYAALVRQIETSGENIGGDDTTGEFHPVAKIAADKLVGTMAVRGGAAAAAAVVGGPAGVLISVGAFGLGAYAYERDKPALEARLRDSLDSALQEIWRYMVEDPRTGVTAPFRHMSARIERGVSVPYATPIRGTSVLETLDKGRSRGSAR